GTLSAAPTPWARLKIGMSAKETVSLLGDPVFRRQGRGFQTWTYDDGAEVLICGLVVGWTAPRSTTTLIAHTEDVWRNRPAGDYLAPVRAVLRQNAAKATAIATVKPLRDNSGMGYEEYLQTFGRIKG
ncbi:MAG TPA: hypothetical protein VIM71_06315, partial [Lacunisphaera sp.]